MPKRLYLVLTFFSLLITFFISVPIYSIAKNISRENIVVITSSGNIQTYTKPSNTYFKELSGKKLSAVTPWEEMIDNFNTSPKLDRNEFSANGPANR